MPANNSGQFSIRTILQVTACIALASAAWTGYEQTPNRIAFGTLIVVAGICLLRTLASSIGLNGARKFFSITTLVALVMTVACQYFAYEQFLIENHKYAPYWEAFLIYFAITSGLYLLTEMFQVMIGASFEDSLEAVTKSQDEQKPEYDEMD